MALERTTASHADFLDHIIDKGIVIDAWVRLSRDGIDLVTGKGITVASIETCLKYADVVARVVRAF